MKQRGFGRIINMASIYATRTAENRVDYVTTKTAISVSPAPCRWKRSGPA